MSDKTDRERALEYLKDLKTDAEIELEGVQEEERRLMTRIQFIVHDIARIWQHNDRQALADVLREMERHK